MIRTGTLKPPIASPKWILDLLEIIKRVKVEKIDKKFLESYNIAKGNESKVISALVFLGIINDETKEVTEKVSGLRVVGEDYKKNLEKIVKEAYKDIFSGIDLENAVYQDLVNFFISHYDYSQTTAEMAARLFLALCKEAGIPLSENLKEKGQEEKKKEARSEKEKMITKKLSLRESKLPELHIHLHADTSPELLDKILSFYEKYLRGGE